MASPVNVALTGASGFVGRHLLKQLLGAGHRVKALIRSPAHFQPPVANAKLAVVKGNLFEDHALSQLIDGADVVIHLVGIIMEKPLRGQTFERIAVGGTRRLLNRAATLGVRRWIHMSALGTRPYAASRYHQTKWQAEQVVRLSPMRYTIFRPSIIHGPDGEFMQMVKNFWCKRMPPFVPYFGAGIAGGGGAGRVQPVWVEDVARVFTEAISNPKCIQETYPLGGPDVYSWPMLYETCRRHLPKARAKKIRAVPAWYAKLIGGLPLVPFNRDQVVMSQEDSVCDIGKVQTDFAVELAPFEATFADYASQIP